jgi:AcrR family transcriptional regulator
MQIQKDDIRKNVLAKARQEFLEKGFKDASMRSIAARSGVGLSNIYNYFRNKDEIFREVLSGLLAAIEKLTNGHNSPESIDLYVLDTEAYIQSQIHLFFNLVSKYKADFNLLLFNSSGSSLENFREQYIDQHTDIGMEYIKKIKEKYPFVNIDISPFFIHTMSSWWMSIMAELVSHDLSDSQLEQFMSEYMAFGTAGWKKIMNIEG